MRSVDTRFWVDVWVRKLNALDRYVFLYFLTNPHSSWCGVYEVDLAMVSFETGIEETELTNVILPRLAPKIRYIDGWVYIPNFEKYHANHSEKTRKGIDNAWKVVPERIRLKLRDLYPIEGVSASASASASTFLGDSDESQNLPLKDNAKNDMAWKKYNENQHSDDLPAIDAETGEIAKQKKKASKNYPKVYAVFARYMNVPLNWTVNKTQQAAAENLYTERGIEKIERALQFYKEHKDIEYCPAITSPYDLDSKWSKLLAFKKKYGEE